MNNEPVAWMDEETGCFVYSQYEYEDLDEHGKDGLIPLYTHPHPDNLGLALSIIDQQKLEIEALKAHPVKEEHFEDEPQAEELHEIMQSNTHPVEEQDESFDRTASHMAGEYVSYQKELTDEEIAEIAMQCSDMDEYGNSQLKEYEFARAILRKAQEK